MLENGGIQCWLAPRDVPPGANWGQAIVEAIDACTAMILLLSQSSNESVHVANEVERAVSKRKRLFPIRLQDVRPGPALELHVSSAQWIDIYNDSERQIRRLVASLTARLGVQGTASGGAVTAGRAKLDVESASLGKFAAVAARFRSDVADLPPERLADEIAAALSQIVVKEAQSYGSWYIEDTNSRAVFGRLRQRVAVNQDDTVRAALKGHLDSKDPLTKWKAMKLLTLFGERDVSTFRAYWESQQAWIPRQLIVEVLDFVGVSERIGLLSEIARFDNSASIRSAAFRKLLTLPSADYPQVFVPVVEEGLRDEHWSVRHLAVQAVASIDVESAVEVAKERLVQDAENAVRVAAANVLSKHGSIDSVALLAETLKRQGINEYIAGEAMKELGKRFGEAAVEREVERVADAGVRDVLKKAIT